jgi:hypothetical protein
VINRRNGYSFRRIFDLAAVAALRNNHRFFCGVLMAGLALAANSAQALVGATDEDKSFASHVVMVVNRGFDQTGFCTGVVIAPRVILTAAHCLKSIDNMRIGYRNENGEPVFLEIAQAVAHPLYHAESIAKRIVSVDLALIETRTPLGARFSPAALDESAESTLGQRLRIFGFGVGREGDDKSAGVLRAATLATRAPLNAVLLWAADPTGQGAGACTGDSGGPIVSEGDGKVLAITAWSAGARRGSFCGALTQGVLIGPRSGWIAGVLNQWGVR